MNEFIESAKKFKSKRNIRNNNDTLSFDWENQTNFPDIRDIDRYFSNLEKECDKKNISTIINNLEYLKFFDSDIYYNTKKKI